MTDGAITRPTASNSDHATIERHTMVIVLASGAVYATPATRFPCSIYGFDTAAAAYRQGAAAGPPVSP